MFLVFFMIKNEKLFWCSISKIKHVLGCLVFIKWTNILTWSPGWNITKILCRSFAVFFSISIGQLIFCCLFFKFNWANTLSRVGSKGDPVTAPSIWKKGLLSKKTNYFFVTAGNKSSLVRFLILGLSRNKSFTKFCSCFF